MFRNISRGILAFSLPLDWFNFDKVSQESKTAKDFYLKNNYAETGGERLLKVFKTDEFGRMSNELNAIYQAGFLGMFSGACYGGFLYSRTAYFDFMDRNQATAFKNHLDAKKKLQDSVTSSFAKGAFRFGWRLGLFTTSCVAITTLISVYRGESSIIEYTVAGAFTGTVYKFNLGLRGMTAGLLIGGLLGTVAGSVSLLILRSTGMTMEEVRYWQYKWREDRDNTINAARRMQTSQEADPLMNFHDSVISESNATLDNINEPENKQQTSIKVK